MKKVSPWKVAANPKIKPLTTSVRDKWRNESKKAHHSDEHFPKSRFSFCFDRQEVVHYRTRHFSWFSALSSVSFKMMKMELAYLSSQWLNCHVRHRRAGPFPQDTSDEICPWGLFTWCATILELLYTALKIISYSQWHSKAWQCWLLLRSHWHTLIALPGLMLLFCPVPNYLLLVTR